jgi:hypothetical protein
MLASSINVIAHLWVMFSSFSHQGVLFQKIFSSGWCGSALADNSLSKDSHDNHSGIGLFIPSN